MDRFGPMLFRRLENSIHAQIALRRRRWADVLGFVGQANVQRATVGIREHRDTANFHLAQRANDPHGDLATIRDQIPCQTCIVILAEADFM